MAEAERRLDFFRRGHALGREIELARLHAGDVRDVASLCRHQLARGLDSRRRVHLSIEVRGAVADNLSEGVDRVGESVDYSSRKVVRNVLIGSIITISSWFIWKQIERRLIQPTLALETSYKNPLQRLKEFFFGEVKQPVPAMIFSEELEQRLATISAATQSINEKIKAGHTNVKYRNLLLWGPPGTGKTMFARLLAYHSGMDYVIMSGASFSQFKDGEGVTQMNKLFEWARSCSNGMILFIDEAEAFLGGREGKDVAQQSYQLLTNFLNLTGERSDRIMLVFATNHAQALDPATKRRIDDAVEMKLPAIEQREGILKLYRDTLLFNSQDASEELKDSGSTYLNDAVIKKIAVETEGFSGGELEGIVNTIISDASVTSDGCLSEELVDKIVKQAQEKQYSFTHGFRGLS